MAATELDKGLWCVGRSKKVAYEMGGQMESMRP